MEDNEVVQESAPNPNPLDMFAENLNLNSEAEVRINSMKKLTTVALALGVEKTKSELIPFLNKVTDEVYNDDEVLMNLAEQLGHFLPLVGGQQNVGLILYILEKLSAIEELVVREKAIESLEIICKQLDDESFENDLIPLVLRLIESEWFPSKCSAAILCSICYPRGNHNTKEQLRNAYTTLCQNEAPIIRRTAATKLSSFINVLELEYINEFIIIFENFAKDDLDSVRLLAIEVGISLSEHLTPKEIEELLLTSLLELCGDPSWKVRQGAANQITSMQNAFGPELTQKHLITIYQQLVQDSEPQVREAAASSIAHFCEILQDTYEETDVINPSILNQIFPLVKILDQDCNTDVKEALSRVITSLSPLFGCENTKVLLLPLITASLMNDSSKIKENIISNLNSIISVIGIDDIADTVLQIIGDLVNNSASIWRTRRNLIVTINYVAKHSGKEYFDQHLRPLYQKLLSDGVYAVRKMAPLILPILIKKFGFKWAQDSILTDVLLFAEHSHYLYRYVCLFCIDELVSPTLESDFKNATTEMNQFKYLAHIANIENGNDKIASFLNRIKKLNESLQAKFKEDWVCDVLIHLQDNDIPDDNIRRYAEGSIEMFTKDNNLNITCVTVDEIENNDAYLEGLLEVILNTFMNALCQLSTDQIDNVQSLVGKTLIKIEKLSNALAKELQVLLNDNDQNKDTLEEGVTKNVNASLVENKDDNKSIETELLEILEEKLKSQN
ncbi:hypothetical protein FQR65_LT06179 [Abscondita terminalis]|nr:hypothetical protein FQR65_LT06179 [Abscondita terminalis]